MIPLEVCVDNIETAKEALSHPHVCRLEICSALLDTGGLTPSIGLVKMIHKLNRRRSTANVSWPPCLLMVLVRLVPGSFEYSSCQISAMAEDISMFEEENKKSGDGPIVSGYVVGAAKRSGGSLGLDYDALAILAKAAPGSELTLHRVFEFVDPISECEKIDYQRIQKIGISRILTNGGAADPVQGKEALWEAYDSAYNRCGIRILIGGGLTKCNIKDLCGFLAMGKMIKGIEFHGSFSKEVQAGPAGMGNKVLSLDYTFIDGFKEIMDTLQSLRS